MGLLDYEVKHLEARQNAAKQTDVVCAVNHMGGSERQVVAPKSLLVEAGR